MFPTTVVLLQLLWLSLASASHFYGSVVTFNAKRHSNGNYGVEIRTKATYDGCYYNYGPCYNGDCGYNKIIDRGQIDYSTNSPNYNHRWCETETVTTKTLTSNRPFQIREYSCCWVWQSPGHTPSWSILTSVDLGRRSDTHEPNNSPDTAILPFLRVPQNCRRSYKLLSFDPDGDKVRCRYATVKYTECFECRQHDGFQIDWATCTFQYLASSSQGVYGFELVVEDFPNNNVNLSYSDGSSTFKYPVNDRMKRAVTATGWLTTTAAITTTTTTAAPFNTAHIYTPTTSTTAAPFNTAHIYTPTTSTTAAPFNTAHIYTPTTATTAAPFNTAHIYTPTTATTAAPFNTAHIYTPTTSTTAAPFNTAHIYTPTTATTATPFNTAHIYTPTTSTTAAPFNTAHIYTPTTSTTAAPFNTAHIYTPTTSTTAAPFNTAHIYTPTTSTTAAPFNTAHIYTPTTSTTAAPFNSAHIYTTTTTTPTTHLFPQAWGAPFSQLPMQFTFQVDPPAPSCAEGEYLPKFVPPTPFNGEVLLAEAGKEVKIKVKAEAKYSVLDNIIMSGPLNVTKHKTTGDEFTIRWTPIHENLGDYFPICFAVEFTNGSAVYQTEMRCVIMNVTAALGRINTVVTCLESSMIMEVEKATLPRLHYENLRLSDPFNTVCSLQTHSNSTYIVAIVPLNACGTQIEEDDDNLLFKNEITTVDNASAFITRRHQLEIKFFCQYAKKGNVTVTFSAHRNNVTVWDKGLGQFTYGFEFYPDQRFVSRIEPRMYPLEYDVGNRIYMKIEATTTVHNTELFVESCSAAPYDSPNYPHPYYLIENGCNLDSTLIVYPTFNKQEFKFSIEAFKFIGLHDKVYISCSVQMCEAGNTHTRCSRGCQPSGSPRVKREVLIESGTHFVSQGPLRLKRSAETGLNFNLIFVTGCALAAVGMICGVLYKTRTTSSFQYQRLSSEEH